MVLRQTPEVNQIAQMPPEMPNAPPMTIEEFDDRLALIKHVVAQMEEGKHYGEAFPGAAKSLLEPGAELLRAALRIQWSYEVVDRVVDLQNQQLLYTFRAYQLLAPGVEGPAWTGSVWNRERRFWCKNDCPLQCDQDHPPAMSFGDQIHNVPDRGLKRAFVALIKNVTGTSGYFKGDAEEGNDGPRPVRRMCETHNKAFTRRVSKTNGHVFYSHRDGDGWCNAAAALVKQWESGPEETAVNESEEPDDVPETIPANQSELTTLFAGEGYGIDWINGQLPEMERPLAAYLRKHGMGPTYRLLKEAREKANE